MTLLQIININKIRYLVVGFVNTILGYFSMKQHTTT